MKIADKIHEQVKGNIKGFIYAIFSYNVLDVMLTLIGVSLGFKEGNPLVKPFFDAGLYYEIGIIKIIMITLSLWIIFLSYNYHRISKRTSIFVFILFWWYFIVLIDWISVILGALL